MMNFTGSVLKESNLTHELGHVIANFTISLPQSVDICATVVKIRTGNSAGMSLPTETVGVGELGSFSIITLQES